MFWPAICVCWLLATLEPGVAIEFNSGSALEMRYVFVRCCGRRRRNNNIKLESAIKHATTKEDIMRKWQALRDFLNGCVPCSHHNFKRF